MLHFFLPILIAWALGVDPVDDQAPAAPVTVADTQARAPEPQVATGTFTTALEVKPILSMTKPNWIAVRLYEGQDLLYFSNLLGWRCGLWDIRYGINGAPADQLLRLEPCHPDMAAPNVMIEVTDYLPYVTYAPESVQSVTVEITYDDGTIDSADYDRNTVLIP